jgi:hypothetical protein
MTFHKHYPIFEGCQRCWHPCLLRDLIVDGSHKQIEYHLPNYWMQVHEEHGRALNTQCIEMGDVHTSRKYLTMYVNVRSTQVCACSVRVSGRLVGSTGRTRLRARCTHQLRPRLPRRRTLYNSSCTHTSATLRHQKID